jgi:hypothetical protein
MRSFESDCVCLFVFENLYNLYIAWRVIYGVFCLCCKNTIFGFKRIKLHIS